MYTLSAPDDDIRRVTRADLYSNFGKRVEYVKAFVGFTDDDVIVFNQGAKYLKTTISSLTDRLYARMLEFDITARGLRTRTTTSDAPVEDLFTIDSPQVQRRKIFWKWYLTRFCSDPSQIEYWEYLEKIGKMHTGKILMHRLTIEYVHMNACLGYLHQLLVETVSVHREMPVEFKFDFIRSIGKILCVQNDLISKSYISEGQEIVDKFLGVEDTTTTTEAAKRNRSTTDTTVCMQDREGSLLHSVPSLTQSGHYAASVATHASRESWNRENSTTEAAVPSDKVSLDNLSIASDQESMYEYHHPPRFVSPFAVDQLQTFETKAWFSGAKRQGRLPKKQEKDGEV